METHGMIFRLVAYIFFGFVMEILVSSVTSFTEELRRCLKKRKKMSLKMAVWTAIKKMVGSVSVFMAPVYGLGLLFLFEPLRLLLLPLEPWVQFLIYGCVFTFVEFIAGAFFDRVCNMKIWDYTNRPGSIMGYTRITLFFPWGFCGIMLSSYTSKLLSLL